MLRQLSLRSSRGCGVLLWLTMMCCTFGVGDGAIPRAFPCPDEYDILPCVCTAAADFTMDMDCSAVKSSNELALIFSKTFPSLNFDNLFIISNQAIKTIRVNDLGHANFKKITITEGILESVVHGALINSYDTLVSINFSNNHVTDFPFDEVSYFKNIEELYFNNNALGTFPHLYSSTLRIIEMSDNPLLMISSTALKDLPNLEKITLQSTELSSVEPGTFTGLVKLQTVDISGNYLTILRTNTIQVTGDSTSIHVNNNAIQTIEINAITGDTMEVWVNNNELKELNEEVWHQMFENNIRLSSRDNPLTCGCEIAWIVLDVNYLYILDDDPACANGTPIIALDPAVYNDLCTRHHPSNHTRK